MSNSNCNIKPLMVAAALIGAFSSMQIAGAVPPVNALWVYSVSGLPSPVTDPPTQEALIQNSSASGVNMLFVSVYNSTPNAQGRYLDTETSIAALIIAAHSKGIQVYAASGDPDWPTLGCAASANPSKRLADIIGYDSANPTAGFDGVILDVEPGTSPDYSALLTLYQCYQQQASAHGIHLAAAINAFWTQSAYEQIVGLNMNYLVVMGYRNTAGTLNCTSSDGILCLDQNIITYANTVSKSSAILIGLDTDNPATSGAAADETFYSTGQVAMNTAIQSISSQLAAANLSFGGFSVNNYRDSYLNGQLSGWPATNPPATAPAPQITSASVTNSASFAGNGVAPGEWIAIFGQNLGPATPQTLQLVAGKATSNLGGVQVLVNGSPAPMVMASVSQLIAIVPYEIPLNTGISIQVEFNGVMSDSVSVNSIPAAPGIFTANSSGTGQAAALNQDYSYNSAANPAAAGTVVMLYLTGAGQTSPISLDGTVSTGLPVQTALIPTAQIGGLPANVLYAGDCSGLISGVIQVNLLIPSGLTGNQPVTVQFGSAKTPQGVTLAVR